MKVATILLLLITLTSCTEPDKATCKLTNAKDKSQTELVSCEIKHYDAVNYVLNCGKYGTVFITGLQFLMNCVKE